MRGLASRTLYVLRHGECEHNVERRLASQSDSPLTENGRRQAQENGRLLRSLASDLGAFDFFASPLHRTCTTMELLRDAAGLPPTGYRADHRLMEMHCGDQIWLRWGDIPDADHASYRADPWYHARPGGESQAQVHARVGAFLAEIQRDSIIVTHQIPARLIRAHYLGLTPDDAVRYEQPHAGIMRLSAGTEAWFGE
jgi:probable phosphoglycerate mutase